MSVPLSLYTSIRFWTRCIARIRPILHSSQHPPTMEYSIPMALRLYSSSWMSRPLETQHGHTLSKPLSHCMAPVSERFPLLKEIRESGGWLSTVNSTNQFTLGAVTVIGTGNTPLDQVQPVTPRYYFYDAPIPTLNSTFSNITSLVSPIASTDFAVNFGPVPGTSLNDTQLALLRAQVATAHSKGIMLRYWDQPGWPVSTRNGIWRQLKSEGVDFINVDDLEAAAGFSDASNYW